MFFNHSALIFIDSDGMVSGIDGVRWSKVYHVLIGVSGDVTGEL